MLEAGNSRIVQRIFLSLTTAAICLCFMQQAVFAAEKVDQSNLPEWAGGWTHINPTPDGLASMWQTFTPEYSTITAVEIDIFTINPGRGDDTLTVEIAKDGEILASTKRNAEDGFEGLLRFEFDEAIAVVPDELYELRVHGTGLTRFGWRYASNTYDAGSRYVSADERPGTDWFFQTYSAVEPSIIYVDDNAVGANDGSSWENAYIYLQDAFADANSAEKPVEIRIAQGIYKPDQGANQTPGNREATFQLINDVTLKGGFAGVSEEDSDIRDVDIYETIFSGDLADNDFDINDPEVMSYDSTRFDNSYSVVTGSGTDDTAVLDGVTISSGNRGSRVEYGGGMYNNVGNPTIINCNFIRNWAWNGGGMGNSNSNPTLINCTFSMNSGFYGGGMYCSDSHPKLTNCLFTRNSTTIPPGVIVERSLDSGGGMNNYQSNPTLANCTFSGNSSRRGGGIFNYDSHLILTNCTLAGNFAYDGLAMYNHGSSLSISNSILWNGGNEIYIHDYASATITYSNIQGDWPGNGNIAVDPLFVQPGYWTEPNPRNPDSSVWIEGDYHLKSEAGRWDPVSESWITDNVTSSCIDAGDPNSPVAFEPDPNGGRINMGAYGGTVEASKSPGYSWFFETTQGPIPVAGLGIVLPHEHIFTDLRGPTTPGYGQADAADVVRVMAPLLSDAREKGVGVLIECSGIGVGRNVAIIAQVAEASGLPVVVPTGVYGRANFAPLEHRNMTEDELMALFVSEIREGIDGTGIKAGFIKIATDEGPMNALLEKILRAAGRAASETGAAVASHTPTGSNAVRQVDILESIDPTIRFIWVHAQNESNRNIHLQLAARGAYIEFDSLGWNPSDDSAYIAAIKNLLTAGHGDRILLSHDAGWYQPGSANGGTQKPFTYLIDTFIPKLRDAGVDDATIRMITQTNPVRAFGFKSGN
jgi:phosphotriesterase-related protein